MYFKNRPQFLEYYFLLHNQPYFLEYDFLLQNQPQSFESDFFGHQDDRCVPEIGFRLIKYLATLVLKRGEGYKNNTGSEKLKSSNDDEHSGMGVKETHNFMLWGK